MINLRVFVSRRSGLVLHGNTDLKLDAMKAVMKTVAAAAFVNEAAKLDKFFPLNTCKKVLKHLTRDENLIMFRRRKVLKCLFNSFHGHLILILSPRLAQVEWRTNYDKYLLASVFTPYLIVYKLSYPCSKNTSKKEKLKIPKLMMDAIEAQAKKVLPKEEPWTKFEPKLHKRFTSGRLSVI